MCNAFSALITRDRKVLWKAGVDSHSELAILFKLEDTKKELDADFVKVELTPAEGYLHPEGKWTPKIDQGQTPHWWKDSLLMLADGALEKWKQEVYSNIDLEGARHPIDPCKIEPGEVGEDELALVRKWVSVRASVRASVRDSMWDSVRAYIGSLFTGIQDWKYTENVKTPGYPFQPAVDLWKKGLIPATDGKLWYLYHPTKDGKARLMWRGRP